MSKTDNSQAHWQPCRLYAYGGGCSVGTSDLRRTRTLAISDAANNINGYELKLTGSGPYTGYDIINLADGDVVDSFNIDPDVTCASGDDDFKFGPMGNLTSSENQLKVAAQGRSFTITLIPATGMVKCVEN